MFIGSSCMKKLESSRPLFVMSLAIPLMSFDLSSTASVLTAGKTICIVFELRVETGIRWLRYMGLS